MYQKLRFKSVSTSIISCSPFSFASFSFSHIFIFIEANFYLSSILLPFIKLFYLSSASSSFAFSLSFYFRIYMLLILLITSSFNFFSSTFDMSSYYSNFSLSFSSYWLNLFRSFLALSYKYCCWAGAMTYRFTNIYSDTS